MKARRAIALGGLVGALAGGPAAAQEVTVSTAEVVGARELAPPPLAEPRLTLADAVALTVRRSPSISQSSLALLSADGQYQQARGLFDTVLLTHPTVTFTLEELTPALRKLEGQRRLALEEIGKAFRIVQGRLQALIDGETTTEPPCPTGLGLTVTIDTSGIGRDPTELAVLGVDPEFLSNVIIDLGGLDITIEDICSTRIEPLLSPEAFANVWQRIETVPPGGLGLGDILRGLLEIPPELRRLQLEIAETVAVRAELARERLADVPVDTYIKHLTLDASLSKQLRNGLFVDLTYQIQNEEQTYLDKPLDPGFGGFGTPPRFYSALSAGVTLPLGKGRGSRSVAAPERAAERLRDSQQEQVRHAVTEEVFRTILSYLNLVAAQDTAARLAESEARQQTIVDLTGQLVTLQTLPQSEVDRAQARAATVAASATQARATLATARVSLAETIGVTLDSLAAAPIATDGYAGLTPSPGSTEALINEALTARRDRRALDLRRDAAAVVAAGARDETRRRFDITLRAGMANLYESPFYRFLPDETAAVIDERRALPIASLSGSPVPPPPAVRFGSPAGIGRAITGRYEPFAMASLTIDVPFGNRTARGRAAQADADARAAAITATDLTRVIGENVLNATETLDRAGRAVALWESAVEASRLMHQAELDRLRIGQSTLLDVVLTEADLTTDELQLVRARQAYLSALARLRFETGTLVRFDDPGTPAETIRFSAGDFVAR